MYFLTSIFLLLYKEIHQNIECKIIWKNSILNLKKRTKKSSVCKRAVQIFPSKVLQIPGTAEPQLHTDAMYSQAPQEISKAPVM